MTYNSTAMLNAFRGMEIRFQEYNRAVAIAVATIAKFNTTPERIDKDVAAVKATLQAYRNAEQVFRTEMNR